MVCTMRLEKLLLEHTDFFLQRGVFRTQMGILRPHAHTRYVVPKGGSDRVGRLAAEMRPTCGGAASKKLLSGDKLQHLLFGDRKLISAER